MTMARFFSLLVLLVAAALASESPPKTPEQQVLKIVNETNEKLNRLTKLVHDQYEDIQKSFSCVRAKAGSLTLLANGKLYSFLLSSKNWAAANETCGKHGLHLATVRDSDDLIKLLDEGKRLSRYTESWWVSAKNAGDDYEKDFQWHDGSQLDVNGTMLRQYGDNQNADCIRINYKYDPYTQNDQRSGKLNIHPCTDSLYYICELPSECY